MNYWTDLFTPETYEAFGRSDRTTSGFRESQRATAKRVRVGDKFICYMVRMSRWVGVLEVLEGPYDDDTPIFVSDDDPFVVRFKVRCEAWLSLEKSVPIQDRDVFSRLTFTRNAPPDGYWIGPLRRSLVGLNPEDGEFLVNLMRQVEEQNRTFPVDSEKYERELKRRIQRPDRSVVVSVPDDRGTVADGAAELSSDRESVQMQAKLCRIGEAMGFKIWLPMADRSRVAEQWQPQSDVLLDRLPLNYDETTLDTIKRIDVLWLKGRTIHRAFEVEHTTAIYSGLLRMADLCALLPNINVSLHIVAPGSRREKVFQEITRPVFSLLENSPLSERCTYLSYDSIGELCELDYLSHTTDTILDDFQEHAE
jgi:predicted RNA-binding protein